jgi:hypothetical protein
VRIKASLLIFCVKIFSQNSLFPIQIINGFFIFYSVAWVTSGAIFYKKIDRKLMPENYENYYLQENTRI